MALWYTDSDGTPQRATPSFYVFDDMDPEYAHTVLGRLLDLMWVTGKLSDAEIVEIIGSDRLSTQPPTPTQGED